MLDDLGWGHTKALCHFTTIGAAGSSKGTAQAAGVPLALADEAALDNGSTGRGLSKGDFGDNVGVADHGATIRTDLVVVEVLNLRVVT